jgi:hypothetical protein
LRLTELSIFADKTGDDAFFFDVEFKKAYPSDYRLSQAADLFCTTKLLALKSEDNTLTNSDLIFF